MRQGQQSKSKHKQTSGADNIPGPELSMLTSWSDPEVSMMTSWSDPELSMMTSWSDPELSMISSWSDPELSMMTSWSDPELSMMTSWSDGCSLKHLAQPSCHEHRGHFSPCTIRTTLEYPGIQSHGTDQAPKFPTLVLHQLHTHHGYTVERLC